MLQEIITCFTSLFSAVFLDAPRVSREMNHNASLSDQNTGFTWEENIHREYVSSEPDNLPSRDGYVQLGDELRHKPTYIQSLLRSMKATFKITLAILPLSLMAMVLIYYDLRTTDLCSEWEAKNNTLSRSSKGIRIIGRGFAGILMYFWFPTVLTLLFGWSEFKNHYSWTILISQLANLINTLYMSFLLLYEIHSTAYYIPVGSITTSGVYLWGCVIVVRKIRQNHPTVTYSSCHIFTIFLVFFWSSNAIAVFYNYAVVNWFNSLDNMSYRFTLAMLTPILALVPTAICRYLALWRTSEIIAPDRSFVLVYSIRASFITLYRIMQADFTNIWVFVGFSLLSGVSNLLKPVTAGMRMRIWARIIKFLNKTCCTRLYHLPGDTPRHRRLKADTEIQNILFESNSLILGQSYIVLYTIASFELSDWSVVKSSLIRIAIGLSIEFVFNIFSTFVRIHWYDIPIARVWSKSWRRHMVANGIVVACIVLYFTKSLLTVFQDRFHNDEERYIIRNCTLPYESWR